MSTPVRSLSVPDVHTMLNAGVQHHEVIRQLVSTGNWSKAGAAEIVRFMTRGPDPLMRVNMPLPRPKPEPDPRRAGLRRGSWA